MDQWIDFYKPFFPTRKEAAAFVERFERLDRDDSHHPAKIMMHQAQRLVTLADDLPQIRPQRESLQLLFLLICAEHISKLHANFEGEGRSRAHTRRFFDELLPERHRRCGVKSALDSPCLKWVAIVAFHSFFKKKRLILSSTELSNHPVSPDELVNWNVKRKMGHKQ